MVKEPAGALIITMPTELLNSEVGDFNMTIQPRLTSSPTGVVNPLHCPDSFAFLRHSHRVI
jgi:hypothetical protein